MNILQNKVFTYLKKYPGIGGTMVYELHYLMKLDPGKHTANFKAATGVTIKRISDSLHEVSGFTDIADGDFQTQKEHPLILVVNKTSGFDMVSQIGIVRVLGLKDKAEWQQIKLTMKLEDPNGGPIGGNGSTSHYGDADL